MHGLSARLCSVTCRCGRGSRFTKARPAPWLCQRTEFVHARHSLYMRAWNRRIRESARLLRVMCSHAWYIDKAMGRDRVYFFALPTARTRLPRTAPCDSVAYAEGVQKRKAFLFLSFSYFSDRRKVPFTYCYFSDKRKVHYAFWYF